MNYIPYNGRCPADFITYTIRPGDTLYSIAQQFNVTVNDIMAVNPGLLPESLQVARIICIPKSDSLQPPCNTSNYYVIQSQDTLYAIAHAFNISLQSLMDANPGIKPESLRIGQMICLPVQPLPYLITISLNAKTLSFYRQGTFVKTYPVAVGKPSTPSPIGTFVIINKAMNPGGPYGARWMGLSARGYGIHGTNNPSSIGTKASNGCIRMFNDDVNELYSQVPIGTTVIIYK
jgi:L,D-transpeptidase ErfK/SrfK